MAEIIFNGISSQSFGLELINEVTHEIASNDIETVPIEGRDGVLLVDRQRLNPVEKAFPMVLKNEVYGTSSRISEWLGVKGWKDLELSWDPDYLYQATVINQISIDEVVKQFGKVRVVFLVHPIKMLKDSLTSRSLSKGQTIVNRGNVEAKPVITLNGYGDTVLTINGRRTALEDIQGTITLDMHRNLVYSGNLSVWDKVLREANTHKPFLDVGSNVINWTGDFTATITPYEGVRL
jgi:phage-related protein